MQRRCSPWLLVSGATMLSGCLLLADPPSFDVDAQAPADGWIDVAVRSRSICALQAEGSLWCSDGEAGLQLEDEGPFVAISQGESSSVCGVHGDGRLFCSDSDVGVFALDGPFVDVSGGGDAGCGLLADGRPSCWPESTDVSGPFSAIGAGGRFACGIRGGSGALQCWSVDDLIFDEPLTDVPLGTFQRVATMGEVGCAIAKSGSVACWGRDYGELLAGPPPGRYVDLSLARDTACAVTDAGSVKCWGENGIMLENAIHSPEDASFVYLDLAPYGGGGCGIDTESVLHCW